MLALLTVAFVRDDFYNRAYPVPETFLNDLLASQDEKWKVLASIGIDRDHHLDPEDNDSPLAAWRNACADLHGVARSEWRGNFDLGFSPAYVRKFAFFLA